MKQTTDGDDFDECTACMSCRSASEFFLLRNNIMLVRVARTMQEGFAPSAQDRIRGLQRVVNGIRWALEDMMRSGDRQGAIVVREWLAQALKEMRKNLAQLNQGERPCRPAKS